jgi:hypothetical protein
VFLKSAQSQSSSTEEGPDTGLLQLIGASDNPINLKCPATNLEAYGQPILDEVLEDDDESMDGERLHLFISLPNGTHGNS